MNKTITIFLLIAVLLLSPGCEKDFSPASGEVYTSQNYLWEVDTLYQADALQVLIDDIWGTDENNVWAVGHSDENKYQIWHWDGSNWNNLNVRFIGHPHSFRAIHGFSNNDIWVVGTDIQNYPNIVHRSFVVHYDGNQWTHWDDIDAPQALSVWGSDPENVYVGCDSGVVLYFNGTDWERQKAHPLSRIYSIQGFGKDDVYSVGFHLDFDNVYDTTYYYFFNKSGSQWNVSDQFITYPSATSEKFGNNLWVSPDRKLYSVSSTGLHLWENDKWELVFEGQFFEMTGTNYNNIFLGGRQDWRPYLMHFNGRAWNVFDDLQIQTGSIYDLWVNDKSAFVIVQDGNISYCWRGVPVN